MDASAATASVIYGKCSPTSFKARSIRHWSDVYLATSELVKYQQGLNTKTKSVITDENVQQKFKTELRALTDESRCPKNFKLMLEERILKTIPNAPKKISLETARRWMIYLGFKCSKQGKGYYTDGHNRPDVTEYRTKFLEEMEVYERRMMKFSGTEMTDEEAPTLAEDEKRVVFITHDESTFYCNEGKALISSWSQNRVKHQNTEKEVKQESKVRISQANLQTSKSQSHITLIGRSIPIDHRSPYFFFSCHRSASNLLVRTSDANFGSFLIKIHSER